MLTIKFKPDNNTVDYIDSEFKKHATLERLNDIFSDHIVKTIDNTTHIKDHIFKTSIRGCVSEEQLSGGCKACLLMYWTDLEVNATYCGDNCEGVIKEIADKKDITIVLEYLMKMKSLEKFMYNGKEFYGYSNLVNLWISEVE